LLKLLSGILSAFFHLGYNKNGIFDDDIIKSTQHYIMISKFPKQFYMFLVKRIIMCAKNSKHTFKFVRVIHGRVLVLFFRTRCVSPPWQCVRVSQLETVLT